MKLGFLLQSVKGGCQELIDSTPNNEEGCEKALEWLKDEYGHKRPVIAILKKLLIYWQSKEQDMLKSCSL